MLLRALVGHPSLRELELSEEHVAEQAELAALGAALGAIVAADAPALQVMNVAKLQLGISGLVLLFDSLPRNHYLRGLHVSSAGELAPEEHADFTRDVLLRAVRENIGLRMLSFAGEADQYVEEAVKLVAARA